jgi:hypothetical protein
MDIDKLSLPPDSLDHVKSSLDYVHVVHETITDNYQFGEASDVLKYVVGMVLGVAQLYSGYKRFTAWWSKRKDERKINQMIQKLSGSNKKNK